MSRMLKFGFVLTLSLAVLLAACSLPGSGGDSPAGPSEPGTEDTPSGSVPSGPCANPLLPVVAGAAWNYQTSGFAESTFVRSIVSVSGSGFEDQDVFDSGAIRIGRWNCEAGNLIALDPAGGASAAVGTAASMAEFETTALSGVTLPASVEAGMTWTQNVSIAGTMDFGGLPSSATNDAALACTAAGMESVSVPAGDFEARKITCQVTMLITVTTAGMTVPVPEMVFVTDSWYAPGVGWVKSVYTGEDLDSVIVLTSYSIP